ncbi:MAG: Lrp/AsnC family transcriptional regulator [Candidatus Bathycorpusculaceae bacterium]
MKEVQRKTLLELVTNCKKSDRELAKVLNISQPTVTRVRTWLEKNNFIREYAAIPEFSKIGLELVAFTFFKIRVGATKETIEEIRKRAEAFIKNHPNIILALRGEGIGCDGILVSLHKNFATFTQFMRQLKTETANTEIVGNFLASLTDTDQYRSLTFKHLKEYLTENLF